MVKELSESAQGTARPWTNAVDGPCQSMDPMAGGPVDGAS